ncbi:MAG: undecaprenyl-phosphate galactose phosphotransferase WbaP [Burkholderiaceae bacterium]|nr:undecaprenyl-phosphate galactose phosphotransferase WbaP [Burkholderiaceae bacterium]
MSPLYVPDSDKYSSLVQPLLMAVADYIAILLAETGALTVRLILLDIFDLPHGHFRLTADYFLLWIPAIFLLFLHWGRTYIRLISISEILRRTFHSVCLAIVACIVVLFLANKTPVVSRLFVALLGVFVFMFTCLARLGLRLLLNNLKLFLEPTIFIGSDETARKLVNYCATTSFFGIQVVGLIDDSPEGKALDGIYPVLGKTENAKEIIQKTGVQNVIILAPKMNQEKLASLVEEIFPLVKNVAFVPNTEALPIANMQLQPLYSENMVVISVTNNLSRPYNRFVKRVFDLIVASLGTLAISPILIGIAIAIKYSSPGPVLYSQKRLGEGGRHFKCWKFRSMVPDADQRLKEYLEANPEARKEWEESQKLKNDPRITRIGHILRKTSLDELPQLWNVITGEMSLVGPRPIVDNEIEKYGIYFSDYTMVRPGMTGLWQVSGRSDTSYPRRVRLDAWYVRNWNVWLDISLIFKTVKVLFSKQSGAY